MKTHRVVRHHPLLGIMRVIGVKGVIDASLPVDGGEQLVKRSARWVWPLAAVTASWPLPVTHRGPDLRFLGEPPIGIEPMTYSLRGHCPGCWLSLIVA